MFVRVSSLPRSPGSLLSPSNTPAQNQLITSPSLFTCLSFTHWSLSICISPLPFVPCQLGCVSSSCFHGLWSYVSSSWSSVIYSLDSVPVFHHVLTALVPVFLCICDFTCLPASTINHYTASAPPLCPAFGFTLHSSLWHYELTKNMGPADREYSE